MNLARRAFLQFTAGVVGGTLLSPLPWKLADDSAIWSQNWSWRPSPERGAMTKKPTICLLCDGGCGVQARLVNGKRTVLVEGNPLHPINQGGVCPVGAAGPQFLYAPYRVSRPMKQVKKRGDETGFQAISWNEALGELSTMIGKLRAEGKAPGVAVITTQRRSSMDALWQQFLATYGSPNFFKMPSQADSTQLAAALTTGRQSAVAFALEKASYVLSFGANLLEGWGAGSVGQAAFHHWHRESTGAGSTKIVHIESRCSTTATKAEQWIACRPGSEAALALSIAHVLLKEGFYDEAFVAANTFGLEDWTDTQGKTRRGFKTLVLSSYAPEQVSEMTGVPAATLRELAKEYAQQKNPVVIWGDSHGGMPGNIYHDLAFMALNVLKGSLKMDGTFSLIPEVPLGGLPPVPTSSPAKRLDLVQPKSIPLPGNGLHAFLDALASGSGYPIDLLMVHEANPAYSLAESQIFEKAMEKVKTLVSFSSYMDETARQSDLILPNPMALERFDDVIGLPGAPYAYYAVACPVLAPQLDTKNTGDVVLELAGRLGGDMAPSLPWKTYEAYLQDRVKGLAASGKGALAEKSGAELWKLAAGQNPTTNYKDGADLWKKLTSGLCWYDAPVDITQNFQTTSGKYEFACQTLQAKGLAVDDDLVYLPHYAPLKPSGSEQEFPLLLVSYRMAGLTGDYLANPPFMTKALSDSVLKGNDSFVQVNPQTARSLNVGEGDSVMLKTPQGELPVRVHLSSGARPGVVYIPQGLGHKAYDQYIQNKGVNANRVIEVQMDPVTGLGTVWTTRAQLRRVG